MKKINVLYYSNHFRLKLLLEVFSIYKNKNVKCFVFIKNNLLYSSEKTKRFFYKFFLRLSFFDYLRYKKLFKNVYFSNNQKRLETFLIKNKIDIIHIFQYPYLVLDITKFCKKNNIKIVFEDEDPSFYQSNTVKTDSEDEKKACEAVDGVIASTDFEKKDLKKRYHIKRAISVYAAVNKDLISNPKKKENKKIECVYIGTISFGEYRSSIVKYILKLVKNKNVRVHIYMLNIFSITGIKVLLKLYMYKNVIFHKPISFLRIKKKISKFDYGIISYNSSYRKITKNFGFKTIEYIFSGLIPIFDNPKVYKSKELGFIIKDGDELCKQNKKIKSIYFKKKYNINIKTLSKRYIMENNIPRLIKFYKTILNNA